MTRYGGERDALRAIQGVGYEFAPEEGLTALDRPQINTQLRESVQDWAVVNRLGEQLSKWRVTTKDDLLVAVTAERITD